MNMKNRTGCIIIALLLCGTAPALAQTTPSTQQHIPLQKTIGQWPHRTVVRNKTTSAGWVSSVPAADIEETISARLISSKHRS